MKIENRFENDLHKLQNWKIDSRTMTDVEAWKISHQLAEAQYPPAKAFSSSRRIR